ncbi:MAG: beta-mannosidase [Armatimonadota bacterium]
MHLQPLDGEWEVCGPGERLPATVPGNIHVDLMRAGRIPDPAVGDNESRVSWVAQEDWTYRRLFTPEAELLACERVYLEFDGLDTLAEVRVNGKAVARTENMHRRFSFEVELLPGENLLEVEFASPVRYALDRAWDNLVINPSDSIPGSPYIRKAMYQWGWDWAPKIPTSGIWRPVRLVGRSRGRLTDVHVRQQHGESVSLFVEASAESFGGELPCAFALTSPDGNTRRQSVDTVDGRAQAEFPIENPKLWWPNGYGDQPLYTVQVELEGGDTRTLRVGLRTLELRQDFDEWGRSFAFVVNGVPVFAKGANWVPADQFPARVTDEDYRDLLESAADANMNMLRVWGGGIYESETFYDLCDRLGILVWQDFMFAGAHYPMEPEFLENVSAEVMDNIRRIRHHPCLALWCGNNEMEWFLSRGWGGEGDEERKKEYSDLFHELLPELVEAEDPATPYWPSSPYSGTPFLDPNDEDRGDGHYWEVWHGAASTFAYRMRFFRFMSEFGFQSFPTMPTVRSFAEPSDWNTSSYVMDLHQKSHVGNSKIISEMMDHFRLPANFRMMVYVSQILQAEAVRYGVEHWRRNRGRCMGTLYWQLNDCWPVASWSGMEYNHHRKALHYSAKKFFAPVLLSAEESDCGASLHVTNDSLERFHGEVRWSLERLDGEVLREGVCPVDALPEADTRVADFDFSDLLTDENRRETVLVYELRQGGERLHLGLVPFTPSKYLELPAPDISVEVKGSDGEITLALVARKTARFVMLYVPWHDVLFSDNFFDLPAGREVRVKMSRPDGLSSEEVAARLKVVSLRDSY